MKLPPAAALILAPLLACAAGAAAVSGRLTDPQIVGILEASDESAWQTATAAAERLVAPHAGDPGVAAFAGLVIADRLTEMQKVRDLGIRALDGEEREALLRKEKADTARLKRLEGAELGRVFVDGATEALAASLEDIDKLLAAADDADLRAHLRERRYLIETHLAKARELKDALPDR